MSRYRQPLLALAGATLAATLLVPAPAGAVGETLKDLVLSGSCPGAASDLKNIVTTPTTDNLWAQLALVDGVTFEPINKSLKPYEISVTGGGLRARHMLPGQVLARPGKPAKNPVTCVFDGATKEEGPFQVAITGTVKVDKPKGRCKR